MRIAAAFLVLLVMASPSHADSGRAEAVVDALGVDVQTADKLLDILIRYDNDLARLQRQRIDVMRRLVLARHDHQKNVESVLDDAIANQRALAQNEEQLITRARKILGAKRAAQLLVLLAATEPTRDDNSVQSEPPRTAYDPNQLFPPGSPNRTPCNPFESMHGCAR